MENPGLSQFSYFPLAPVYAKLSPSVSNSKSVQLFLLPADIPQTPRDLNNSNHKQRNFCSQEEPDLA